MNVGSPGSDVLQHYDAIMRYISQPPLLLDVHIHKPMLNARTWMDSLLAFFPGLQVGLSEVQKHLTFQSNDDYLVVGLSVRSICFQSSRNVQDAVIEKNSKEWLE